MLLTIHILAGLLSLVAGAVALFATKGSTLHRRGGIVFAVAMLTMTSSAFVMAQFLRPNRVNVVAATITFYLVATAWLAVKRPVEQTRSWLKGLLLMAAVGGVYAFALALEALGDSRGIVDKVPAPPLFLFAGVAFIGVVGDWRMLRAGSLEGVRRISRHLWRMTFALWIATASFFLGQAKFFPLPIRRSGILAVPVLLVLGMLVYWLIRVRIRRRRAA